MDPAKTRGLSGLIGTARTPDVLSSLPTSANSFVRRVATDDMGDTTTRVRIAKSKKKGKRDNTPQGWMSPPIFWCDQFPGFHTIELRFYVYSRFYGNLLHFLSYSRGKKRKTKNEKPLSNKQTKNHEIKCSKFTTMRNGRGN